MPNGHKVLQGDIQQIQPQEMLDLAGMKTGEPFWYVADICQPFSTAGKRLGINDPRGKPLYGLHTDD